ncbi:MAG: ankyrin repeat domain-containing protein [Kiritimatiellales bacterium]
MKRGIIQTGLIAALCLLAANLFAAGETPIHKAAKDGNVKEVRRLLDRGVSTEVRDKYDCTPLHIAVCWDRLETVKLLISRGADVNAAGQAGATALLFAARAGCEEILMYLLDHGANIETKDKNGRTPLLEAAFEGRAGSVMLLLNRGANINAKDCSGETPLGLAVAKGNVATVQLLRRAESKKPTTVASEQLPALSEETIQAAKEKTSAKLAGMNMNELLAEQPLDSEGAVLALSDALLEAESEKLPAYLLQNPGSETKLLVEVKKRLRDAQVEMTKCNNKAQIMLSDGNSAEAERMLNLAAAIQGYQASLLSLKSELEKY